MDTLLLIEFTDRDIQEPFLYEPADIDAALADLDSRDAERHGPASVP